MKYPNAQGLILWQCNAAGRSGGIVRHGRQRQTLFRVFVAASSSETARVAALAWLSMVAPGLGEPAPDRIKIVMPKGEPLYDNEWRDGEIIGVEVSFASRI